METGQGAAMPGQRTAEGRPERGVPLQGFPSLGSRPRDVPQTSSRSRFRHGNDSAGERFFHVQVRFSPQRALVTITFEGEAIQVEEGTTVAAAVLDRAGGETRTTARKHDGRGPYCHMGVCYECLMEIDGVPNQQSCLIPVREGMSVKQGSPERLPSGQRRTSDAYAMGYRHYRGRARGHERGVAGHAARAFRPRP